MLLCGALPASAQHGNPYEGDPGAVRAGAALYAARCADCHGPDAKGNRGPDLTQLWTAGANDERVFAVLRAGVAGSIMPPSLAPDSELWAIVAHLRSIGTVPPLETSGDPARGAEVFAAQCSDCHSVNGQGGAFGPDLTRIVQLRSREALVRALREPSAAIGAGFRAVTLVTGRGVQVHGVVKSRDAFSIQIVSADGRLQGYWLGDLASVIDEPESAMPVFTPAELDERALEDVLAFLAAAAAGAPP